jgi:hypothetical protein
VQGTFDFQLPSCLTERFGAAFFRALPKCPGVYLMRDGAQRVVYVGKAKNLRARLNSYRCADARVSRKTARLVRVVREISWEVLGSEEEALLRENVLLRELRPRFNRANTFPQRHAFIALERAGDMTRLRFTREESAECHGAFKGQTRAAFHALSRLLWAMAEARSYAELPHSLVMERGPAEFELSCDAGVHDMLREFLAGESNSFGSVAAEEGNVFFAAFKSADVQVVEEFFAAGPARNRALRAAFGVASRIIAPAELDDLVVRLRFRA